MEWSRQDLDEPLTDGLRVSRVAHGTAAPETHLGTLTCQAVLLAEDVGCHSCLCVNVFLPLAIIWLLSGR